MVMSQVTTYLSIDLFIYYTPLFRKNQKGNPRNKYFYSLFYTFII